MTDYHLSPVGNDANTGTLAMPWRTMAKARGAPSGSTVYVVGGRYVAPSTTFTLPLTLVALEPVIIESAVPQPVWTQVTLSAYAVWHASVNMPNDPRMAYYYDTVSHRVPLWTKTAPLFDTAAHWAESVLNPGNLHTRWGLWGNKTDLYVIPPVDGAWTDPNVARVNVTWEVRGIGVNGPDFTMSGPFTIVGHATGIRADGNAARMHLDGLTLRNNSAGVNVYATQPLVYGHDHLVEHCVFEDDLSAIPEGTTPVPHHMLSWNIIKASLSFGIKDAAGTLITCSRPTISAESVGFRTEGGSFNSVVKYCTFRGTFDGVSHYQNPGRFDYRSDTNLLVTNCDFTDIADDVFDRAGHQNGVVIQNITARNVGVVMSPAPLWGTVTLKNVHASLIGGQVRVPDGTGSRPPGSVVKYGAANGAMPRGVVNIEDSIFWSNDPTTQGLCPDGGDGVNVPEMHLLRTTIRVGRYVLNWGKDYAHPADWLTLTDTTLATSATVPCKTNLKNIAITPVAEVDARYANPAAGDFEDAHMIATLQAQIVTLEAELVTARAALQAEYDALQERYDLLATLARTKQTSDGAWSDLLDSLLAA